MQNWVEEPMNKSVIFRSWRILSSRDRFNLIAITILHTLLSFLDLIAVALTGILGSLTVTGVSGRNTGDRVGQVLRTLGLNTYSFQEQVAILAFFVSLTMILKTIASAFLVRKTFFYMSRKSAFISAELLARFLQQPLTKIQSNSMQENLYNVTGGVQTIVMGVLNSLVLLMSDVVLLIVLVLGLFFVEPTVAFSTLMIFSAVGVLLYKLMRHRATELGVELRTRTIQVNEIILQVLYSYREIVVRNTRSNYAKLIGDLQIGLAQTKASSSFLPYISKYIFEVTIVLGSFAIAGLQFLISDSSRAVSVLMVFLVSSLRIGPAVLRLQTGALGFRQNLGVVNPALELIESLSGYSFQPETDTTSKFKHHGFIPKVELRNISMRYQMEESPTLKRVSFSVEPGTVVAIVGPSGAGKSTLLDVILGIREADEGEVRISGKTALDCYRMWPGAIAFVPQDSVVSNLTIRENIALGFTSLDIDESMMWEALDKAQLKEFVESLPSKLDTVVGDRGMRFSGGQRQRLGIARALYTKPKLLVLDEATSSLDGITEYNIAKAINELRGQVTVILIAHRLSTIREANTIFYLRNGELVASGTFNQVRREVPQFDEQANLMNL